MRANAGDGGEGNNKRVDDARFGAENQLTKHVENSKLEHERAGEMIARDDEIAFKRALEAPAMVRRGWRRAKR